MKLRNFFIQKFSTMKRPGLKNIFKNKIWKMPLRTRQSFLCKEWVDLCIFLSEKVIPALIGRHMPFNMSEKAANRWLLHMKAAVAETTEIDKDSAERMMAYFTHTAYFLSIGVTGQQKMQREKRIICLKAILFL